MGQDRPDDQIEQSASSKGSYTFKHWSIFWLPLMAIAIATGHPGWAFICLVSWAMWPLLEKWRARDELWKSIGSDFEFKTTDGVLVKLDMNRGKLATKKGGNIRVFDRSDIVAVDVERDGSSVQTIKRGTSFSGALIGALIGGGVGAMIGAQGGTSTATSRDFVQALALRLTVADPKSPFVTLDFLTSSRPLPADSPVVRRAVKSMEDWRARFAMLLRATAA